MTNGKNKRRKTAYTRTKRITVFLRFYYYITLPHLFFLHLKDR